MFKKEITVAAKTRVKSSVLRGLRARIIETYPALECHMDNIIPKKEAVDMMKVQDKTTLYILSPLNGPSQALFWQHADQPLIPHLRLVHRYPKCFHRVRIDRGAIRFVLSGAALMVPGLTSVGGRLPRPELYDSDNHAKPDDTRESGVNYEYGTQELDKDTVVVVEAEGKENACLVGPLLIGTQDMKNVKKGIAMDSGHYLGDGLWNINLD